MVRIYDMSGIFLTACHTFTGLADTLKNAEAQGIDAVSVHGNIGNKEWSGETDTASLRRQVTLLEMQERENASHRRRYAPDTRRAMLEVMGGTKPRPRFLTKEQMQ